MFYSFSEDEITKFFSKVDQSAGPYGCWPWTGCTQKPVNHQLPYGIFFRMKAVARTDKVQMGAHRASMMIHLDAPIPAGLHVLHTCNHASCVNPMHLRLGTAKQNSADRVMNGRTHQNFGRRKPYRYLTLEEATEIYNSDLPTRELHRIYQCSKCSIHRIRKLGIGKRHTKAYLSRNGVTLNDDGTRNHKWKGQWKEMQKSPD